MLVGKVSRWFESNQPHHKFRNIMLHKGDSMKRTVEIRSAEGGEDSKLFVKDLAAAYIKHFTRVG